MLLLASNSAHLRSSEINSIQIGIHANLKLCETQQFGTSDSRQDISSKKLSFKLSFRNTASQLSGSQFGFSADHKMNSPQRFLS
jgi:hypothetical protein